MSRWAGHSNLLMGDKFKAGVMATRDRFVAGDTGKAEKNLRRLVEMVGDGKGVVDERMGVLVDLEIIGMQFNEKWELDPPIWIQMKEQMRGVAPVKQETEKRQTSLEDVV